jgi:hypothetical protein
MEDMDENGDTDDSIGGVLGAGPPMDEGEKEDPIIPGNPDMAW